VIFFNHYTLYACMHASKYGSIPHKLLGTNYKTRMWYFFSVGEIKPKTSPLCSYWSHAPHPFACILFVRYSFANFALVDLELVILLPLPPKFLDNRHVLLQLLGTWGSFREGRDCVSFVYFCVSRTKENILNQRMFFWVPGYEYGKEINFCIRTFTH
jgi:hypothetical protein